MAGRKENLKPKTSPQARGKLGGIKSVKVRKEKKLMSQIYADLLADQSGIKKGGGIRAVAREILNSTNPKTTTARVSLMREIREGTEGSKIKTETVLTINTDDDKVQQVLKEFGIVKPEPKN
ncbi:MAG: hypothetical protein WC374_07200 [Phycisphaerae bacterium]|jgi:hypothetical protein